MEPFTVNNILEEIIEPEVTFADADPASVYKLAEGLGVHPAVARLLVVRGLDETEEARGFLWPDIGNISDPADFPGLPGAVEKILETLAAGEKVFIAGDFDVDGLTATAVMVRTISALGGETLHYIPNRLQEGYDLSDEIVTQAADEGAGLLVTVDCGTRAVKPAELANRIGLPLIITDHHRLSPDMPPVPVINPHLLHVAHPAHDLSGVGVAFKVAQEMLKREPVPHLEAADLLPLVALGTVCDVVDLRYENRTLVRLGLESFHHSAIAGLWALLDETGLLETKLSAWHLAYILGPRLNAAGRLGQAGIAEELLIEDDPARARRIADKLAEFNVKRRSLEADIFDEVERKIEETDDNNRMAYVMGGEDWHSGVIGIVASRVVEKYGRPAVMVTFDGETGKGSCRSIPAFDIHTALEKNSSHLIRFGGHRQAAGFEIARDNFPAFAADFADYSNGMLTADDLKPVIKTDGFLPLSEVDFALTEDIQTLEPIGTGNPKPAFVSFATLDPEKQRVFKNLHLELIAEAGATSLRSIGFGLAPEKSVKERAGYALVYSPRIDDWGGREKIELRLGDLWPATPDIAEYELIDRRTEETYEVVAQYTGKKSAVYAFSLIDEVFPANEFVFDENDIADVEDGFDTIVLYSPPHSPGVLNLICRYLSEGGRLVVPCGPIEASRVREHLGKYYPDKDFLGKLYRWLKVNPDLDAAGEKYHPRGVERGLRIFSELGLTEIDSGGITLLENKDVRKLSDSATFVRNRRLATTAENLIEAITTLPKNELKRILDDYRIVGMSSGESDV
ncbi:MAG: single-stranded-DNA-specific exonuclease RecJ [bacterium]|nr:single-stranded-DNA-specific exonuclease RecJ [bacterium]